MAVLTDIVVAPGTSRRDHRRNERDLFEAYMLSYLGAEAIYSVHPMRMFMGVKIIDIDQKFTIVEMPEDNRLGAYFSREVFCSTIHTHVDGANYRPYQPVRHVPHPQG